MGFLKSLQRLGKAVVGTVVLPIDVVVDTFDSDVFNDYGRTERRAKKIARNVRRALEEIDE